MARLMEVRNQMKIVLFLVPIVVACLVGIITVRYFGISDDDILEVFGREEKENDI